MPLTDAQTTQVFEIFGIPQGGAGYEIQIMASLYGAFGEAYDMSALVTALNTKLTALTATQLTRVTALLTQWDTITSYDPLQIYEGASGTKGRIVDRPLERENIRNTLANIIGFFCPRGGFRLQIERSQGGGGLSR